MLKTITFNHLQATSNDPALLTPLHGQASRIEIATPLKANIPHLADRPLPGRVESAWFESDTAALATYGSASLEQLVQSGPADRLITREFLAFGSAEPPGDGSVRGIFYFRRSKGMTPEAFGEYWRVQHTPLVLKTPGLRRYVQSHLVPEHYTGGKTPLCDGVTEIWFDSVEAFAAGWNSPEMQIEQNTDAGNFISEGILYDIVSNKFYK